MHERHRNGYTLVEVIVAMLLFSVGGLALASTAAMMGKQLNVDLIRERAGRMAVTRLESLRAGCGVAVSGGEEAGGIGSNWSVSREGPRVSVTERVTYSTWQGGRSDSYVALIQCR